LQPAALLNSQRNLKGARYQTIGCGRFENELAMQDSGSRDAMPGDRRKVHGRAEVWLS
jgi:hypothetical protein